MKNIESVPVGKKLSLGAMRITSIVALTSALTLGGCEEENNSTCYLEFKGGDLETSFKYLSDEQGNCGFEEYEKGLDDARKRYEDGKDGKLILDLKYGGFKIKVNNPKDVRTNFYKR